MIERNSASSNPADARKSGAANAPRLTQVNGDGEREAAIRLSREFAMEFWETVQMLEHSPDFRRLPLARSQQRGALLMVDRQGATIAVISDPYNVALAVWIEQVAGTPIRYALAAPSDIHAYLVQQESKFRAVDTLLPPGIINVDGQATCVETLSFVSLSDTGSAVVKLVNSTLYDALRSGASDVHFESTPSGLVVKYRVDGVLDTVTQLLGTSMAEQAMSRLKVLAELDIAEQRVPQDGSFRVSAEGRDIDLRVSIMPSVHGEDAVVRILDRQLVLGTQGELTLGTLGFDVAALLQLRELMEAPYGMLLVTGPTGSGKTTTLYGVLAETRTGRDKIITIEDPVEYQLPGVLQIPVNEKKGLSFARGLRSILRHDPDTIMIGEIRDSETAEIAVQSALTGHRVLTTVHANNVFDVFGRFTHMGLDPYALVSALNGIWAQRLVRINCQRCSEPVPSDVEELTRLGLTPLLIDGWILLKGLGCGDCRGTGFKGRKAIAEILRLDDELRELILRRAPMREIKQVARIKGTKSLTEAALALVAQGLTTLEEVRRVTVAA